MGKSSGRGLPAIEASFATRPSCHAFVFYALILFSPVETHLIGAWYGPFNLLIRWKTQACGRARKESHRVGWDGTHHELLSIKGENQNALSAQDEKDTLYYRKDRSRGGLARASRGVVEQQRSPGPGNKQDNPYNPRVPAGPGRNDWLK